MKPQTSFIDLTQRPPRSFRVRLGGFVILARMLDKGRATLARKNGEYKYNSTTDQHLVRFLGFDADAMLQELAAGKGDGKILEWIQAHSKTQRAPCLPTLKTSASSSRLRSMSNLLTQYLIRSSPGAAR